MIPDPYRYFRIEARQLVDELSRGALDLEKGRAAPDLISKLLRLAHTLKGAARVVKQGEIAGLAHAVEEALSPLRDGSGPAPREGVDAILGLTDQMTALLARLAASGEEPKPMAVLAEETVQSLPAEVGEMDTVVAGISEAMAQLQALERSRVSAESAKRMVDVLGAQLAAPRATDRAGAQLLLVGDLRAEVGRLEENLARGRDLVQRELRQVLEAAERLRLLPVKAIFGTLERVARDAARALRKQVVFEAEGGEIRLDGAVLTRVQSALVQLVRNAIAHGIEDEGARQRAGKAAAGRVRVRVVRRGSRVSFTCADDGPGIDLGAVERMAREKGLVEGGDKPAEEELFRILLKGGLSTSGRVTEVAGRGVGLDVVREVVDKLGGQVLLRSSAGKGAEVELWVPVSLAAVEALIVESAGQRVAIPMDSVHRALRLTPADFSRASDGDVIVHEGQALPLVSLAKLLGDDAPSELPRSALVVTDGVTTVAVAVDRILGSSNIVLRPLPALTPRDVVAGGACLDGDGNAQLVLDEDRLLAAPRRGSESRAAAVKRRPILVVDDSLTTRMLEQSILESAGFEVDLASSAEEALEMAVRRRYGLFLADVEMPGMDGFTFVQTTRAAPGLGEVPAILVTSRDAPEDRQRGRDVGALSYFVKSEFDQGKLLDVVRRTVG
jgi:two-component system, chemotaxis family, sensor kinase CheA